MAQPEVILDPDTTFVYYCIETDGIFLLNIWENCVLAPGNVRLESSTFCMIKDDLLEYSFALHESKERLNDQSKYVCIGML